INLFLSDTYCSLVAESGKTVFFNNASEIKEIQDTKFFRDFGFIRYIGSPIHLYGEIAGTLSFYSFDSESSLIEEHLTEVIELMCKSISSEIEKRRAMEEVHRIKLQQDGDYFLTSLLIKPLAQHRVESSHFSVEFLLKQKKEFKFKNRENEIGGDICIAHSLQLRGRQHIVFLNADAMGKSLQGAGGALVMGSVFGSIIERTKIAEPYRNLYPEQWLSAVFTELQKIFESFDYSMLVSVALGVIEDDTGLLYYINAEHPSLVLYRDDTVEFIENKYQYYKLGTVPQNRISINTFQLKPGDVIIAGSDGRDDIYLQTDEAGNKKLNYDEQMFLHHVKNGQGRLNE
ncbi:MAG TPA: PP2C family protein-serine/threonine phosphatase, partial [Leptospiraceae bacterium]|nr:PP2C family protein-serine/threonine phosphatase [Leptospiraceae bacterium]